MTAAEILQLALLATDMAERLVAAARDAQRDDPIELQDLGDRLRAATDDLRAMLPPE